MIFLSNILLVLSGLWLLVCLYYLLWPWCRAIRQGELIALGLLVGAALVLRLVPALDLWTAEHDRPAIPAALQRTGP